MAVDLKSISLRSAIPEDRAFIADTFLLALRESIAAARGAWDQERERTQFFRQLQMANTWIVQLAQLPVGFYTLLPSPNALELHTLCIVPLYQCCGIGGFVTQSLQRSATGAKQVLLLSVLKSNPRASSFYKKLGFVPIGESEHHVRFQSPT